jgi:hypothetical protein
MKLAPAWATDTDATGDGPVERRPLHERTAAMAPRPTTAVTTRRRRVTIAMSSSISVVLSPVKTT